ncbi:hypothetical protein DFH29DRAFT_882604 [Suillus ampliporus]|nr:hypothetical protein DFH29DRAFT_882604 [Suillus ampliporus]
MARAAWEISLPPRQMVYHMLQGRFLLTHPPNIINATLQRPVELVPVLNQHSCQRRAEEPAHCASSLRNASGALRTTFLALSSGKKLQSQGAQLRCQEDQAATALKKTKAAATANKKAQNPTQKNKAAPSSKSRTRMDAEGDDDLELDAAPTPAVDNDVNMDIPAEEHVPALPDQPEAHEDIILAPSLQQLTPLDILKSIEALGNKFDSLLKKSDHAKAMHQEMDSRDIESQTDGNVASIGYITNALANLSTARVASFTPPPTGLSAQGHPYGQIPGSWVLKLPSVPDASQPLDHAVSTVGRQWTTFWDQSKGPEPAGLGDTSASAVQPSGSNIRLSGSSQLSSLPSAASSPKD